MSEDADIRLESVTKRFGDQTAVDDLTLSIPRGEFYALLGPSGCGKTTSLRMIGGFEDPTSGKVYLGGDEVTQLPPYKRDVNTVFQSYALFPHLSVENNVGFGLERKKVGKGDIKTRVGEALEMVQLGQFAQAQAGAALRRPAAARRARPRAGQPPAGAAARRAARRARPAPAQAAPAPAQADPAGRRHHVRARDARPGGGHEHGRHDRGHARRQDRAGRRRRRPLRAPADRVRGQLPRRLEPDRRAHDAPATTATRRRRRTTARRSTSRPTGSARTAATRSRSACGRRRSPSPPPEPTSRAATTCCAARSSSPRSWASRSTTSSASAGGEELTVFQQNLDGAEPDSLGAGREVQLSWDPQHTFVVAGGAESDG